MAVGSWTFWHQLLPSICHKEAMFFFLNSLSLKYKLSNWMSCVGPFSSLEALYNAPEYTVSHWGHAVHQLRIMTENKALIASLWIRSVSCSVMSDSLWPHGLQLARFPYLSPTPGACSNSCPLNWWCHPTISSYVPFSSCRQSFPASGCFPVSQFFASGGQIIGTSASASVFPVNIQD